MVDARDMGVLSILRLKWSSRSKKAARGNAGEFNDSALWLFEVRRRERVRGTGERADPCFNHLQS
jgi:hypothetical protein